MKMTSCTLILKDYGVYIRIDLDMIDKAEESDLLSVYSTAVLTAPLCHLPSSVICRSVKPSWNPSIRFENNLIYSTVDSN